MGKSNVIRNRFLPFLIMLSNKNIVDTYPALYISNFSSLDKILHVIEKLDSLDQTSTELFKDTLIKYGPKLETENPGKAFTTIWTNEWIN